MKNLYLGPLSLALIFNISNAMAAEDGSDISPPHDHGHEIEEIFVTGAPHNKSRLDILQGSSLLDTDDLDKRMQATIGETLSGIPGISSTFFGSGASRPIIRGLGGDRVRVLINGIGSIDASSTSPDHAVAGDPLTAERVEVMRGASTLLYGSNAVGGVINIIDGRIPGRIPEEDFSGRIRTSYNSVARDISAGAALNMILQDTAESAFVLHVDGSFRKTQDYHIPGLAESARFIALEEAETGPEENAHEEEMSGRVENSDVDNRSGALGLSWIGNDAMLGFSYNINKSNYGIPGHSHGDEVVRIDLDQKRFDLKGILSRDLLIFEEARLRIGTGDYEHTELEGSEIGTIFLNKGWEGRLELIQKENGRLHGSMGLQLRKRDFEAVGEEAFVPPTHTFQWGIFAVEEIELEPVTLEIGGRLDHQKTENKALGLSRSFNSLSFSAGAAYHPTEDSMIGLSLGRTERAPTPEELFSNGPHLATNAYEMGSVDLSKERATSVELSLKKDSGSFSGSLNIYHTWFSNFIHEENTGDDLEGLTVFAFRQKDARFYGAEVEGRFTLMENSDQTLDVSFSGDIVRAKFTGGSTVPRIPAKSATLGLDFQSSAFDAEANIRFVGDQKSLASGEIPTDSYTTLDLNLAWRPYGEEDDLTIRLQGQNLTNEERRQHTSFLKDLLPMPGRAIKLSLAYGF